ncbi:2'-5' RNA ligase family protein [Amycolatopsis sp. DG1A-15b]|uniref:2'-5' RNA ligase family protein n=1 Tax=Amycolatopsis sp. DG1A-15b TaxID=3052846 RepID=UPI00255B8BB0|nr:2'-5' RNA ligase family protein [Amycolatopsis sp. DG1A-15b]WIX90634.1 2'-5' RNA ligase family protein [Amycolatopsis sp. DG1A-15b]
MDTLAGATETAVIVPVPAADAVVGPYRQALDHSAAWGVPAHVTVLYPFLPPDRITAAVAGDLGEVLTGAGSFECVFSRVAWFGQEVVWLAPDPAGPFRALTERVWGRFPQCPPYGGAHPEVIPHLTIGSTRLGDRPALSRAAAEVAAKLPIRAGIDRVRLIAGNADPGSWRTVAEFALAAS